MATRTGFKELLALKTSLDRILGPFGGEFDEDKEEEILLPSNRFINPGGKTGADLKSHRYSTKYAVGDLVFNYTAQWPDRLPRYSFETLSTADPSVMGELQLYGRTLWEYRHTPLGLRAMMTIVSSEEKLEEKIRERVLDVVNDRASQYSALWTGLLSGKLLS